MKYFVLWGTMIARKLWKLWYLTHFFHHLYEMNHTNTCLCHLQFVWTEIQPVNSSVSQMLKLGKVPQPTEFGGKGIKLGHRAMDLSWIHSLLALVHFTSAPNLALVTLQNNFVGLSATAGAGWGFCVLQQ